MPSGTPAVLTGASWLLLIGLLLAARTRSGRRMLDRWKLRAPLFGNVIRQTLAARCLHTVRLLLSLEVPALQAIGVAQQSSGNVVVSAAMAAWHESVKEGENMMAVLEPLGFGRALWFAGKAPLDDPESFPNQLRRFAEALDREVQEKLTMLQTVAGPVFAVLFTALIACLVMIACG